MSGHTRFRWYASADAEIYEFSAATRDAVIARAFAERMGEEVDEDGKPRLFFYIVEATKADLRIADFCLPVNLFETARDALSETEHVNEDGECPGAFECANIQKADLRRRLQDACHKWQDAHDLRWESFSFVESRNEETIVIALEAEGGEP